MKSLKIGASYKVRLFSAESWTEAKFVGNHRWELSCGGCVTGSAVTEIGLELGPNLEVRWRYDPFA